MLKKESAQSFRYAYEEFADHLRAMQIVRQWEETSRFGYLGKSQTNRANRARIVEYFLDTYENAKEALFKAEIFLTISDYLARLAPLFIKKNFIEQQAEEALIVDPGLLRAVHLVFTANGGAGTNDPKRIMNLARAIKEIEGMEALPNTLVPLSQAT